MQQNALVDLTQVECVTYLVARPSQRAQRDDRALTIWQAPDRVEERARERLAQQVILGRVGGLGGFADIAHGSARRDDARLTYAARPCAIDQDAEDPGLDRRATLERR